MMAALTGWNFVDHSCDDAERHAELRAWAVWVGLALPVLFFVALYVLMILPNQRKQKKWQEMLGQIKSGDQVTTSSGMRGTVLQVKDDAVVLRLQPDGIKMEFVKTAIATVTTAGEA